MNKDSWNVKPFEKCIKKIIYTNKIKRENYLSNGKYPIISQDDSLISGYWEKEQDVFYVDTPLVIFGDHTRILKYIDFNFVLGADGVKILLPKDDLIAKFFYYYLVWYNIPNLGYSRHYKLLKEIEVLIPPIFIQEQIVKELDTLCDIITKKKEQLAELDKLAQATFYDMFGDPIKNEKRWVNKKLSEVCHFVGGGTPPKANQNYYQGAIPWATVRDMSSFYLKNTEFKINEEAIKKSATNIIPKGSIIIATRVGLGKVCLLKQDTAINQDLKGVIPNEELNNIYLGYWFKEMADEIIANGEGATVKGVTLKFIHNLNIFLPPILFQTQFAEKIEAIDQQKALINQSIADVQLLFNYTMDKYFN